MLISSPHNLSLCSDSQDIRFLWNVFEAVQKISQHVFFRVWKHSATPRVLYSDKNFKHYNSFFAIRKFISKFTKTGAHKFSKEITSPQVSPQLRGQAYPAWRSWVWLQSETGHVCHVSFFILKGDMESGELLINFKTFLIYMWFLRY